MEYQKITNISKDLQQSNLENIKEIPKKRYMHIPRKKDKKLLIF